MPTMIEIGVASPKAQGQAIIRTVMVVTTANVVACPDGPKLNHARNVRTAMISTVGTKIDDTLSARRPIAGFDDCATRTISIICDSTVSLPMRLA